MREKGKFRILSYILEDYIIYYKSINRNKKIIAFSIFKASEPKLIIPILNKLLENNILNFYSIQFDINGKSDLLIILNFEDYKKINIIKLFQMTNQELNLIKNVDFLKDQALENEFIKILIDNISPDLKIAKIYHSIKLKYENKSKIFEIYSIDLSNLKQDLSFITNFLKFSKDYKRDGHLIFNFSKNNHGNVIVAPLFIHIGKASEDPCKTELNYNKLYNCDLISKEDLNLNNFFCILWRTDVFSTTIPYSNVSDIFNYENQKKIFDISSFHLHFEEFLKQNHIEYKKLNKNLFLIEFSNLFFIFPQLDSRLILNILKKYVEKYFLYIIILNEIDYAKIIEIKKINRLKNVRILCPEELETLKVELLRNKI